MSGAPRQRRRRDSGTATVNSESRSSGQPTPITDESRDIPVEGLPQHVARVHVGGRMTYNMGNYESIQVSVSIELPCAPDDESVESTYQHASRMVDDMIGREAEVAGAVQPSSDNDPL